MVKKKSPDQEKERYDETVDNKADNRVNEDLDQTGSPVPPAEEPVSEEGKASDKVVKEEPSPEEKLAEMQDRYLRLSAEFDNYRKRSLREKMELYKYASEEVLLKILPVMDDFERALANMENATDCLAIKSGIDLIYAKFTDFLKQNEVREIESINSPFNVDLHDAVAKTAVEDEAKKGIIVDVVKKGYYLKDKVIRHAKVVIGE
ncbi:MAG: nucleotide exchange factor GrpE [Bacteroidales bacterium]|jgi:molecular chaperone GrpE|nr:nucleotide exchange factor GrpE [Bacteroidales bacterium]